MASWVSARCTVLQMPDGTFAFNLPTYYGSGPYKAGLHLSLSKGHVEVGTYQDETGCGYVGSTMPVSQGAEIPARLGRGAAPRARQETTPGCPPHSGTQIDLEDLLAPGGVVTP